MEEKDGAMIKEKITLVRYLLMHKINILLNNMQKWQMKYSMLKSIGLRFFNIYGPNQKENNPYSGVIPIFINRAKK